MEKNEIQNVVKAIGQRLYDNYGAQKVVFFGSYVSGTPHEDSDIDLFIIKDTPDRPIDRQTQVRRLVRDLRRGIPFSPIVLTPTEVDYRLKIGDQFIENIFEHGVVI
jgi:predicted nucleotidyltransferase